MSGRSKKVKVWVRTRPTANFAHDMIDLQKDKKAVNIHCPRDMRRGVVNNQVLDWSFKLDGILHNSSQEDVFSSVCAPIVKSSIEGYNSTLLCYGQTGAGKTFTMTGATEHYKHRGLIPRAIAQLFKDIEEKPDQSITIRISYLEIYNETMFDLLSTINPGANNALPGLTPMTVVEDENGCYIKGLSCHLAQNEEEALNLLFEGETNRAIASHTLNKMSSRSHCIFTVYIESRSRVSSEAKYTMSKINFVDLAGSERLGKTQSAGKTKEEAMYINKSLSFLEQVVVALANKKRDHVPFRQSKLTHCLKDSIGGQCNTVLIANVWGEASQIEESVSTLRFATRMMCVHSEPAINQLYDPAVMVKNLEKEIMALKRELAMHDTFASGNRSHISYDPLSQQQRYEISQQVEQFVTGQLDEIDIVNVRQIQGVYEAFRDYCNQMEKDIEEKLRTKYTLIDKSDPSAISAAQQPTESRPESTSTLSKRNSDLKAGIPIGEDGELVGDPDGSNFGVGVAPSTSKPTSSAVVNAKKRESKKGKTKDRLSPAPKASSPTHSNKGKDDVPSLTPSGHHVDREDAETPSSSVGSKPSGPVRPSTPPNRPEAFETFKREAGSEINRILSENKEILGAKKKAYANLAQQINCTKSEMDKSKIKIDKLREEREGQGAMLNEEGDIIISEEEYLQICRLKDLKVAYRSDFDELKQLKSEVQYCQKLVDQCRQRLIQEFDNWYTDSFLTPIEGEPATSVEAGYGQQPGVYPVKPVESVFEDEQEKFDRLQRTLLLDNPESAAFHNAKLRVQRRKTYETAMSQVQPYIGTAGRKAGTPTRHIRNAPPSMLQVQY